jgi:hypothetical protein
MVDMPNMVLNSKLSTSYDNKEEPKNWGVYICNRCGGVVLAVAYPPNEEIAAIYPNTDIADINLPEMVRYYLDQAMRSVSTPGSSILMSGSAVDQMLKEKGYTEGNLNSRIIKAVTDKVLTEEMGKWAHQVRLDTNSLRHADGSLTIPSMADAKLSIEFTKTLGDFLFVLPSKVSRGITGTTDKVKPNKIFTVKKLNLPNAYRNASYHQIIKLDNSEHKPVVMAELRYTAFKNSKLVLTTNLEVSNVPGNPRWWQASLFIENCNSLPSTTYLEIIVDGQVFKAGQLLVSTQPL